MTIAVSASTLLPAPASAATPFGQAFTPTDSCTPPGTIFQSASLNSSYAAPAPGVITSWSMQAADPAPQLKFKVVRPAGGSDFTIVGQGDATETLVANQLNTYGVRIPVQAGDLIGYSIFTSGSCRQSATGYTVHVTATPDPAPGTTLAFIPGPSIQLDIGAILEPDCDSDGSGDETQDPDIASCLPPPGDTTPPETTITKRPKDKTKKKTATFEFSSTEVGSTFECKLDDGAFAPCTSPHTVKVKKGKHSFQVRAKDAAGNVDPTPAIDDWKVKKKRRK